MPVISWKTETKRGNEYLALYVCDVCGIEKYTTPGNLRRAIESSNRTWCRSCSSKENNRLYVKGKTNWARGRTFPERGMENSRTWKGGRYLGSDGYVNIYTEHRTYKKEHRFVMEQFLGRSLLDKERVHHINGKKDDNWLGNLYLCSDEQEHKDTHMSAFRLVISLLEKNLVKFIDGKYMAHGKLGELLEQLEEANQQPSESGNILEGSETRELVQSLDCNLSTSAQLGAKGTNDDIVRSVDITNETTELENKESQG